MPERNKKFHEFAIQSILFKGRTDWYFCYLKAEKIAHVLLVLKEKMSLKGDTTLQNLVHNALVLPQHIAHFAAGEMDLAMMVGDIFGLLSMVRLAHTEGTLSAEHALILEQEYEKLAEKMAASNRLSPFISADNFSVPELGEQGPLLSGQRLASPAHAGREEALPSIKDIKGHTKGHVNSYKRHSKPAQAGSGERTTQILEIVRKAKRISIKGISALIKGCSEKTIQRELSNLIGQGLIVKEGERRWSVYLPA